MDHGWRPYAGIVDINMPGSYMVEWLAVHVFGPGTGAWRLFDIVSMLIVIAAASFIPPRGLRWAGMTGGVATALFHLANGPVDVGERDWSLMVLLLAGFAFYTCAIRQHRASLFIGFAACSGFAAAIKPPAFPLPFALLLLGCFVLYKEQQKLKPYLMAALGGALIPVLAVAAFLLHYHAFGAFFLIAHGLVPFYAASGNMPLLFLLHVALGVRLLGIALLACMVASLNHSWRQWETQALAIGVCIGAFLYLSQRKGWQQHKETLFAFLLLFIFVQFAAGLRRAGVSRIGSVAGLGLLTFTLVQWTRPIQSAAAALPYPAALQADLTTLGGPALSGNVQCVEMVTGCIEALYNTQLQPATGFIFDSFLFTAHPTQPIFDLRTRFLGELMQRPPRVLILGASDWEARGFSYDRLAQWPAFGAFLDDHYQLRHDFNPDPGVIERGSYRLYLVRQ